MVVTAAQRHHTPLQPTIVAQPIAADATAVVEAETELFEPENSGTRKRGASHRAFHWPKRLIPTKLQKCKPDLF
jgi:hypothetical protein